MKLIIMKQTLQLLIDSSSLGDEEANSKIEYYKTMNIVEKEHYLVLIEKSE